MLSINTQKKGAISLYLAIVLVAIMVAIVLGLSVIIFGQLRMMRGMGHSVVALSAADAGIERVLMRWADGSNPTDLNGTEETLSNLAIYELSVLSGGEDGCDGELNYCITSVGSYMGVRRAIEIKY